MGQIFTRGCARLTARFAEFGCSTRLGKSKLCRQVTNQRNREGYRSRRHAGPSHKPSKEFSAVTWIRALLDANIVATSPIKRFKMPTPMQARTRGIDKWY
jgi:hypothetical protein